MKVILATDPIRFPLTGIGRYTLELAQALGRRPELEQLRFFAGLSFRDRLPEPEDVGSPGIAGRLRPIKAILARSDRMLDLHQSLSHWRRGKALAGAGEEIFHGPNFYLPPFRGASVATIHDLSVIKHPQFHPPERVRFMKREIALTLKRADALITVSEAARRELAEYFNWPLDRIHATQLASSPDFHPRNATATSSLLTRLGLGHNGYALYVGTIEPRKNLEALLAAYEMLPQALRLQYPLVLAGFSGWQNDAIMKRLRAAEAAGWAHYLGFLQSEQLPVLFAGARAFLFPSLYEGFGLPVLEAMASGVPVVTSNTSSLPEVAGGAALLCDPQDLDGLASAFRQALEDDHWRQQARAVGLGQAGNFSWERCALETVKAYETAARYA
jgi:alpha-1,3-rhamnosyl/mannosyltransferase